MNQHETSSSSSPMYRCADECDDQIQDVIVRPKPISPVEKNFPGHQVPPRPPSHDTCLLHAPVPVSSHKSTCHRQVDSRSSPGIVSDTSDDSRRTSIRIDEDLKYIQRVVWEDTVPFVPNIRYGKVLSVEDSATTLVVASRIFNGYTTVLSPVTYRFSLVIAGVQVVDQVAAREVLTHILVGRIVSVPHLYIHPVSNQLHAQIYIGDVHLNQWLVDQHLAVQG